MDGVKNGRRWIASKGLQYQLNKCLTYKIVHASTLSKCLISYRRHEVLAKSSIKGKEYERPTFNPEFYLGKFISSIRIQAKTNP